MNKEKALVILSGGQDSVTCLYWALKTFGEVEAITFFYGQNHEIELGCSGFICVRENVPQKIVNLSFLPELVESALTSKGNVNKTNSIGLPSSFVPNRNQLFITLSHAYAQKINAKHLVMGVCQTDYSGYPDCRSEFVKRMEAVSNYGSASNIKIHTPLMYLSKADTFLFAEQLGRLQDVIDLSHTCYNGNREIKNGWGYGCGVCPACVLRSKGYYEYLANQQKTGA